MGEEVYGISLGKAFSPANVEYAMENAARDLGLAGERSNHLTEFIDLGGKRFSLNKPTEITEMSYKRKDGKLLRVIFDSKGPVTGLIIGNHFSRMPLDLEPFFDQFLEHTMVQYLEIFGVYLGQKVSQANQPQPF